MWTMSKLRPDQFQVVNQIVNAFDKYKAKSPCVVMPTGAGKTATILHYLDAHESTAKVVWLVPRVALIDQVWAAAGEWMPQTRHRLRVTTVQALIASNQPLPQADLAVVDEAHYFYGSPEWSSVAHAFPRRIAATATPTRADGAPLGELCDRLIIGLSRAQLSQRRILPPIIAYGPPTKRKTEWQTPEAAYALQTPGERAIVFCGSIAHAKKVAENFRKIGVRAGCATSDDGQDLQLHRAKQLEVLTNVFMVGVGYDDPSITVVILARPMGNPSTYLQAIGRARGTGAPRVALLDLFGTIHEWGLPEEERSFSLTGIAIKITRAWPLAACSVCSVWYRTNPYRSACKTCNAPLPQGVSTRAAKFANAARQVEERRKVEPFSVRRGFFVMMAHTAIKNGHKWLAQSAYRKRYGINPSPEWLAEFDLI